MCRNTKKGFIIDEIERRGYPLELYISGVLKGEEYSVYPNQYYYDNDSGIGREFDIRAEKEFIVDEINSILRFRLLIECKKIPGNAWIFFEGPQLQQGIIANYPQMVTVMDDFDISSTEAIDKIRVPLCFHTLHYDTGFFSSGYKEIVLDRNQSTKSNVSNIWNSEITLIKTILSEKSDCLSDESMKDLLDDLLTNGYDSWFNNGSPQTIYFLFPVIVFQGDLYSARLPLSEENLREIDYVCLKRDYKSSNYNFHGTIDIVKKSYFIDYLESLETDFEKTIQSTINNWGSYTEKERELLYINNQR